MDKRKKCDLAVSTPTIPSNHYNRLLEEMQGTQCQKVLKYILDKGSITSIEAFFDLGITRLPARVYDLRHDWDVPIDMERVTKKTLDGSISYGRYYLLEE